MKHPRAGEPQESNGSGFGVMADPRVRLFEGSNALKSGRHRLARPQAMRERARGLRDFERSSALQREQDSEGVNPMNAWA